jgi:hypothetical protein
VESPGAEAKRKKRRKEKMGRIMGKEEERNEINIK